MEGNCSQHKKEVAGITDMKELAEMIGNLHYETLSQLFEHLRAKFEEDSHKDRKAGRKDLSNALFKLALEMMGASTYSEQAWKISKPFMTPIK